MAGESRGVHMHREGQGRGPRCPVFSKGADCSPGAHELMTRKHESGKTDGSCWGQQLREKAKRWQQEFDNADPDPELLGVGQSGPLRRQPQ